MHVVVKKWGNSASIRIPAALLKAVNIRLDEPVNMHEEAGRIVIEPIRPTRYALKDLVAGITRKNLHDEEDFGGRTGREIL